MCRVEHLGDFMFISVLKVLHNVKWSSYLMIQNEIFLLHISSFSISLDCTNSAIKNYELLENIINFALDCNEDTI